MVRRLSLLAALTCLTFQAVTARAERTEAKITLVQLTTRDQSPDAIIERMTPYFAEASAYGSDLIVFPEDGYCKFAADAYGCVVGANITDGTNTGFAGSFVRADGIPEEARLFPRIKDPGDGCVHATIDLQGLRRSRKHLRTMHQRRPELYGRLTEDIKIWQDYPGISWDFPECEEMVNRAQLEPPEPAPTQTGESSR